VKNWRDEFNDSYRKFLLEEEPKCKFCGKSPVMIGYCCQEAFQAMQQLQEKQALDFLRGRGYNVPEKGVQNAGSG
jgi:hypothetical protein